MARTIGQMSEQDLAAISPQQLQLMMSMGLLKDDPVQVSPNIQNVGDGIVSATNSILQGLQKRENSVMRDKILGGMVQQGKDLDSVSANNLQFLKGLSGKGPNPTPGVMPTIGASGAPQQATLSSLPKTSNMPGVTAPFPGAPAPRKMTLGEGITDSVQAGPAGSNPVPSPSAPRKTQPSTTVAPANATPNASPTQPSAVPAPGKKMSSVRDTYPNNLAATQEVLSDVRKPLVDEVNSNPQLSSFFNGAMKAENAADIQGPAEATFNRAAMNGQTVAEQLKSGFFGPVNRGEVSPRAPDAQFSQAMSNIASGSTDIGLLTDQGLRNEHLPAARIGISPTKVKGEYYSPMGRKGVDWANHIAASGSQRMALGAPPSLQGGAPAATIGSGVQVADASGAVPNVNSFSPRRVRTLQVSPSTVGSVDQDNYEGPQPLIQQKQPFAVDNSALTPEQFSVAKRDFLMRPEMLKMQRLDPARYAQEGERFNMFAPKANKPMAVGDQLVMQQADGSYKSVFSGDKPTTEMQNYQAYFNQERAAGNTPLSFFDWNTSVKRAGVAQPENEFDKALAKNQAERIGGMISAGDTARGFRTQLEILREHSHNIGDQGVGGQLTMALAPLLTSMGIDPGNLSDMQAFDAIIQKTAPAMRAPGSGSTSDIEFKGFMKSLPSLIATVEGRELVINQLAAIADDAESRAEVAAAVANGELSRKRADSVLRRLPNPLAIYKQYQQRSFGSPQQDGQSNPQRTPYKHGQRATLKDGSKVMFDVNRGWIPVGQSSMPNVGAMP